MRFVPFNSPEYMKKMREQRIHEYPGTPDAVAVHLVFNELGYVIQESTLTRSMGAARRLVHGLMEEADRLPSYLERHATLTPITALQACVACNTGGMREHRKALWQTATYSLDHMSRVKALSELACLAGILPRA